MAAWALLRQSSEEVSGRDSRIMATAALRAGCVRLHHYLEQVGSVGWRV